MNQSHTFITLEQSNVHKIDNNKFIVFRDSPLYTKSEIIIYDFKEKIVLPYVDKFDEQDRQYDTFFTYPQARFCNKWGKVNEHIQHHLYSNINEYPELHKLIMSLNNQSSLMMYENGEYELAVWDSRAYVVSIENKITSVFIDNDYSFQQGDCETYVWINNDCNFAVYNDGDVYSVLFIVLNGD